MKHPDELTLLRMVDSELPPERATSTRAHLVACARCQGVYEALKTETEILRAALREDQEPLPQAYRPDSGLSWFVAAAVGFGALGVTSFWSWFVEPVLRGMGQVGLDGTGVFTTILIRGFLFRGWTDMATIVKETTTAIVILAGLALASLWGFKVWRRFRSSPLSLSLLVLLALPFERAEAAVIEVGRDSYTLEAGETIENDLIVAAEIVRIQGTLAGDLIVAASFVEVSGTIQGDVLGVAGGIEVTGRVEGNVRTASRSLDIEGLVTRNVTAAGETIRLHRGAELGGSFTAACREAILSAPVGRDLLLAGEAHELGSRVGGSALIAGERLTIGSGAVLEGPVRFYGASEPVVSAEASLASPVEFEQVEDHEPDSRWAWLSHFVYFWAAAFVLGAAFVLLGPGATEAITAVHVPSYGKSIVVGLLAVGGVLVLAGALMVTLVGIPLGLVTLAVWCLGLYVAQVYVATYIGRELLGRPTDRSQVLVRLAVGLLAVHIAKSLPYAGFVVTAVVSLWGFGALTLWFLDGFSRPVESPAQAGEVG